MNSRVSWSVEGIEPSVRERAEAAARRAGMSLGDWLNSTIGETASNFSSPNARPRHDPFQPAPRPSLPPRDVADVAEIHQRLDAITRQIDQFSRPALRSEPGVARQLNEAISRLDARLSQISEPARYAPPMPEFAHNADMVERAAAQVYSAHAPIDPFSLDFAIAEIAARQGELDGVPRMSPRQAPPIAPVAYAPPAPAPEPLPPAPDISGLERQLLQITTKIDELQRPDTGIEESIAAFRVELADIRNVITEAMPRRAIESVETEIQSLSRRIEESRDNGIDAQALAGVERALGEIRETLLTLTPAEQLAGFDDAIRNLGGKIDLILRSSDDPVTRQQLEGAIGALRAIVSNVASNEALGRLSDDLHSLSSKVDQLARPDYGDSFAALEQRIAVLTSTLENRERPEAPPSSDHLEVALQALSSRLDHLPVGNDSSSAFAHLEQRVTYLLERIETVTDPGAKNLGRVEDGLQDVLRHLERQQATIAALAESRNTAPVMDPVLVDTIKRELSDFRFSQSETDRHTQDSLEVVHSTLGHVVDRLAIIEGDLRSARTVPMAPPSAVPAPAPAPIPAVITAPIVAPAAAPVVAPTAVAAQAAKPVTPAAPAVIAVPSAPATKAAPSAAATPPARPQLQNPVLPNALLNPLKTQSAPSAIEVRAPQVHFDAAPREFAATAISHEPAPAFTMPKAISDILAPPSGPATPVAAAAERSSRPAVNSELPPDHPLEPGTRPQLRTGSPSERIAASEEAISELSPAHAEPVAASSFIAAARRAAQAAAAGTPAAAKSKAKTAASAGDKGGSTITSKIRALLVGASVVVIVLGSFKVAMTLLDSGAPAPVADNVRESLPLAPPEPAETQPRPVVPAPIGPSMTSPTPIGRQSLAAPVPFVAETAKPVVPPPPASADYASTADADVTGSIAAPLSASAAPVLPASNRKLALVSIPASERLPEAIGSATLRSAALRGDASAAFEIGVRYAEGKGVAVNYDEAAKWYDRASLAGVVPAMFRLGTLYEKGLSVKKDLDVARRYYVLAAERGNAKAMHNLAVLDADGGSKGANYKSASLWFRKAAERGVADSQFNLGILYARGIGVEQNLAESFKWFSLAAAQGDTDASRKRDDIAKRLDPQSLAAAKQALQNFVPEGQPDDAINVAAPAGGWDGALASAKPVAAKRAAK
jgi:localization factor PodJL